MLLLHSNHINGELKKKYVHGTVLNDSNSLGGHTDYEVHYFFYCLKKMQRWLVKLDGDIMLTTNEMD